MTRQIFCYLIASNILKVRWRSIFKQALEHWFQTSIKRQNEKTWILKEMAKLKIHLWVSQWSLGSDLENWFMIFPYLNTVSSQASIKILTHNENESCSSIRKVSILQLHQQLTTIVPLFRWNLMRWLQLLRSSLRILKE